MNRLQVAKKYSRSIIESVELDRIPSIIEELRAFNSLIEANKQLKILFTGMIFDEEEKLSAFDALRPHLKISNSTEKYLRMMIINNHLIALRDTVESLINLYNEKKNRAKAVVMSPIPLENKYLERLKKALGTITGRDIEIETLVDPSLLGGFIVRIGSMIYDSSLKGQLRLLRAALVK